LTVASNLFSLKRLIDKAWLEFQAKVKVMGASCSVRPSQAGDVFHYADGDPIVVTIRPVTFLLKEKPDHPQPALYVVVEGLIHFRCGPDGEFRAEESKTRVGYFVKRNGELAHVYGVHHDFDATHVAHPVFHSQMAPMKEYRENINDAWKERFEDVTNHVQHILTNVRIPSAQMDAFAVFLQLCSDHLISSKSGKTEISAYKSVLKICAFYKSAYPEIPRMQSAIAQTCFRPHHWYDGSILPSTNKPAKNAA
jgi:hypothetical protein